MWEKGGRGGELLNIMLRQLSPQRAKSNKGKKERRSLSRVAAKVGQKKNEGGT